MARCGTPDFGRVAALALCGLLAADEDAAARRAHRRRRSPRRVVSEFTGKPNPPGPDPASPTRASSRSPGARSTAGPPTIMRPLTRRSCELPRASSAARRPRATRGRSIRRWSRSAARRAPRCRSSAEAARNFFEENFRPAAHRRSSRTRTDSSPAITSRSSRARAFRPTTSRCRSTAGRATSCTWGASARPRAFPTPAAWCAGIARGKYVPYFDRAAIEDGALATRNLEICYLKDANDRPVHPDPGLGARAAAGRLGAARQLRRPQRPSLHAGRPHPDRARHHQARGHVDGRASANGWRKIRTAAKELRRQNKSYVFFRITGLPENEEARGAQGVPLTAARSIAVDRVLHVYGTPFFIARRAADRDRDVDHQIPPPDDRAGHRLGDRRAGARRHLFRRRRGGRPHRRPDQEPGALRDADAARARSGRGRPADAAAGAAAARRAQASMPRAQAEAPLPPRKPLAGPVPLPRPRPKS